MLSCGICMPPDVEGVLCSLSIVGVGAGGDGVGIGTCRMESFIVIMGDDVKQ